MSQTVADWQMVFNYVYVMSAEHSRALVFLYTGVTINPTLVTLHFFLMVAVAHPAVLLNLGLLLPEINVWLFY